MQNTWSACKYIDLWWHRSYASFQGQNLRVCWELLKKKKNKNRSKTENPRGARTDGQNVPGKNRGIAQEPGSGFVPCAVGSSPDASGQESCVSVLSLRRHTLCWGTVWVLCRVSRYFRDGVWSVYGVCVWSSHCPAGALLDLQGFGGRWHENVLRKMFYYFCFCQLHFGELY